MNIQDASDELYNSLRNHREVVGAGVQNRNDENFIIIYLTEKSNAIRQLIPPRFKNFRVVSVVSGPFQAHSFFS
jgi:hypothetical protein